MPLVQRKLLPVPYVSSFSSNEQENVMPCSTQNVVSLEIVQSYVQMLQTHYVAVEIVLGKYIRRLNQDQIN